MNKKETNTPQTVFELIEIDYEGGYDENDEFITPKYPEFKVHEYRYELFSTLAKAEQGLKKRTEESHYDPKRVFGFKIVENYLNLQSYGITRIYLPDGSFLDESLAADHWDESGRGDEFFGRPEGKVRFQNGDLAEYHLGDYVNLVIIGNPPISPEEVSEHKQKYLAKHPNSGFNFECMHDYYIALGICDDTSKCIGEYGWDTHIDAFAIQLFPVRFPVSDEIRNNLEKHYQKYRSYIEKH